MSAISFVGVFFRKAYVKNLVSILFVFFAALSAHAADMVITSGYYIDIAQGIFSTRQEACEALGKYTDGLHRYPLPVVGKLWSRPLDDVTTEYQCQLFMMTLQAPPWDKVDVGDYQFSYCGGSHQRYFLYDKTCDSFVDIPTLTPPCNHCGDGSFGQPIDPGTGNMWHVERDYINQNGVSGLALERTYNSSPMFIDAPDRHAFGNGWSNPYDAYLRSEPEVSGAKSALRCYRRSSTDDQWCEGYPPDAVIPTLDTIPAVVALMRGSGRRYVFTGSPGAGWTTDANINDRLNATLTSDGINVASWILTTGSGDSVETYDSTGKLISIATRAGTKQRLTYSNGLSNDTSVGRVPTTAPVCSNVHPGAPIAAGRLLCVTDDGGRQLQFEYNETGQVNRMIDPSGRATLYEYDGPSGGCIAPGDIDNKACSALNLTRVTYPDGYAKTYWYNEAGQIANTYGGSDGACTNWHYSVGNGFGHLLHVMTGLEDENQKRYISWTYDCSGRATSSQLAGGNEKISIRYDWTAVGGQTVTHTFGSPASPMTTTSGITYIPILTVPRRATISAPCIECGPFMTRTYDAAGNVASTIDWNNTVTSYTYDTRRNLETSRTEAYGTAQARTTTTQWHAVYRLPTRIAEPKRLMTFTYDSAGNILSKTVQATSDESGASGTTASVLGKSNFVSYTYNNAGQILTQTGPRTDIPTTTSYGYDAQGNLATVTDAAAHTTTFQNYDVNGRAGRIIAANGTTTDLTYGQRGWLTQRVVSAGGASATTRFDYDGAGQLITATLPDRSVLHYEYDNAHRLTSVADSLGSKVTYSYDLASHRVADQVSDSANVLTRKIERIYDAVSLLLQQTGDAQ